jgi:hypothetical protein
MRDLLKGAGAHINCAAELPVAGADANGDEGETELVSRPYTPYVYPAHWTHGEAAVGGKNEKRALEAKEEGKMEEGKMEEGKMEEGKMEEAKEEGKMEEGKTDDDAGRFEVVVKRYETGRLSSHLCSLVVGDMLAMNGPIGGAHQVSGL